MNQVTNLIQWKNLTQEQKDDFDFEGYDYEYQICREWIRYEMGTIDPKLDIVYRLVIEDDKWYTVAASGIKDGRPFTTLGSQLEAYDSYRILRPARPNEVTQTEKTLEQKIQEKWPDKEVVMLSYDKYEDMLQIRHAGTEFTHIVAQSVKGFYKYVYVTEGGVLYIEREPTDFCELTGKTIQPRAVLFEDNK